MNATTLVGTVVGLADADDKLDDETKYLILAALEGEEALDDVVGGRGRPAATVASDVVEAEPVGAFLSQIAVSGFRGIGETATLTLQPGPGITVVSGRNGSGKSSFAEAFELAVTGDSYRWRNKAKLWTSSWRNIHHGDPCRIRVDFAVEGAPPATDRRRLGRRCRSRRPHGVDAGCGGEAAARSRPAGLGRRDRAVSADPVLRRTRRPVRGRSFQALRRAGQAARSRRDPRRREADRPTGEVDGQRPQGRERGGPCR